MLEGGGILVNFASVHDDSAGEVLYRLDFLGIFLLKRFV